MTHENLAVARRLSDEYFSSRRVNSRRGAVFFYVDSRREENIMMTRRGRPRRK